MLLANVIFPAPAFVYALGALAWPFTVILMAAEAISIWLLMKRQEKLWRVSMVTIFSNVVSTLLGVAIVLIPGLPSGLGREFDGQTVMEPNDQWIVIARYAIGGCYILSILSEGVFYKWCKIKGTPARPWTASALANSISYAPIMALALAK